MISSLRAIALVSLVFSAVAVELIKGGNIFAVSENESLSNKDLAEKLAKKLTSRHEKPDYAKEVAHHVANLLAKAQDKIQPEAVLGVWSVADLLSLNHFDLDKCTMTELKVRDGKCKKLSIHENLHRYCQECLQFFKRNCMLNRELVYKRACKNSPVPMEDFLNVLINFIKDAKALNDKSHSAELANGLALPETERLVVPCQVFNGVTEDLYNVEQDVKLPSLAAGSMSFVRIQQICQVVLSQKNNSGTVSQ